MAIPQEHTNYAANIVDELIAHVKSYVNDVVVENRHRFPDDADDMAFLGKYGRAILIRLDRDEKEGQQHDTWESRYSYTGRVYVDDPAEISQGKLSDLVEDFKHQIRVNQINQTNYFHSDYTSVTYNEPSEISNIKTADVEFYISMRVT